MGENLAMLIPQWAERMPRNAFQRRVIKDMLLRIIP